MRLYKPIIFFLVFASTFIEAKSENLASITKDDSLTLAQAYINLSLTEVYFDKLSLDRIAKILPFEEREMASIQDSTFIHNNLQLYDFAYALLYFNQARFLFDTKKDNNRQSLLVWKQTLGKAIAHFNQSRKGYFTENEFYDFIGFENKFYNILKEDILRLKEQVTPLFNQDIYPDFKRIFYAEKNNGGFDFDSLTFYTSIYELPLSRYILDNEDNEGHTINPLQSENSDLILTSYDLDTPLDMISRYLQLSNLSKNKLKDRDKIKNSCILYVQYLSLKKDLDVDDSNRQSWHIYDLITKDNFWGQELNETALNRLYGNLTDNYQNCFTVAQAFLELDTLTLNAPVSFLPNIEQRLTQIKDSTFIEDYNGLLHTVFSRLFYSKSNRLFSFKAKTDRETLLNWKNTLDPSIQHYNSISAPDFNTDMDWVLYQYLGFEKDAISKLDKDILDLKKQFNPYFNQDIYPDFKRIFYLTKKAKHFKFDSLSQYTDIYNLPLSRAILVNSSDGRTINPKYDAGSYINDQYSTDIALDLISRFLQLNYITNEADSICAVKTLIDQYHAFEDDLNLPDPDHFGRWDGLYISIPKDDFFLKEMRFSVCFKLYRKLYKVRKGICFILDSDHDGAPDYLDKEPYSPPGFNVDGVGIRNPLYYFPIPAPFPSAYKYVNNYKPALKSLQQVNQYISGILDQAGYLGHKQYYYVESGYAMTTSLEAINKDGSPLSGGARWDVSVSGRNKLSMYETFKSIFLKTKSDFRVFAFVVMPAAAFIKSKSSTSVSSLQDLIEHSYPSLPNNLEGIILDKKTLSIFVYHYHQDDVGEVPMLDISNRLSVDDHLKRSGLSALLRN